ncbi:hypothetical protein CVT26_000159 [Gymnopilus dilepis]|uniref:Uncharacterized protein n=1 Tax=Gymnopilus dilepis TaxID=231916 RepID=A0A409X5W1_9AGAR|nr:hypothetical protein CVT26_000159 [Gymnopilus dilepis]
MVTVLASLTPRLTSQAREIMNPKSTILSSPFQDLCEMTGAIVEVSSCQDAIRVSTPFSLPLTPHENGVSPTPHLVIHFRSSGAP